MKKIFKYSIIVSLCAALVSLSGCQKKEVDVDPMGGDFAFSGMAPNPVMRGGALRIYGRNLDQVSAVNFAGDIEVTEFVKLSKGAKLDTLEVIVPLEGPEVGKVVLNVKDGRKFTSFADLSYSEPIEVESIAPKAVLSGDVLTIKGEYLNDVKEVIFTGEDAYAVDFESQSRHELKVVVPANAISGPVILSDVNEVTDANSIPNHIYTEDLTVGDPTVTKAAKATYKSGDAITVSGAHLDMIANVALPQVAEVPFTVAKDGKTLSFNLPAKATDGNIVLTSFAGKEFEAGEIETVSVKNLVVKSLAEDSRFKAGCEVEITGTDLDLVTKVEFPNAEAEWTLANGKITTTLPATAKDGAVVVTLDSGKQVSSEDITVVKPEILAWEYIDPYVAGETDVIVEGKDLDLVTSVKMGDKKQGFIDCEFTVSNDEAQDVTVKVSLPEQAYTGPIIFTSEAGYETATDEIVVTYKMAVSIQFDAPSFAMGKSVSLTGSKLLQIEQVYVKGQKVTDFAVRADDAMSFALPEKVGPGVYRLDLVLVDGTELTWPIPFEVTAPFTETFFWEGNEDLSGGAQPYLGGDGALAGSLEVGDLIRVYFSATGSEWWFEIYGGHWDGLLYKATNENTDPSVGYLEFEVTDANIGTLTSVGGWGGVLVVQGSVTVTGASVIHFGATETVVWEGTSDHTGDYANNIQLGGEDDWVNAGLTEGAEVRIYFTPDDPADWSVQVFDGHWNGMGYVTPNGTQWNNENDPEAASKGYVSFVAEGAAFTALTTHADWGNAIILQGKNMVFTKVSFQ